MHHHLALAATALLAGTATAQNMLRFACGQLVVERTDPIVNPGQRYTPHLHQIVGGNSFNISMEEGHDPVAQSTCTTCSFVQDLSNYWTASMFFHGKNGSYKRVPQQGNGGPQGALIHLNGGMDIYYIPSGKTTAFRPGFRMIAGNAAEKSESNVNKASICHRCWDRPDENTFVGGAPCSGSDTVGIPKSTNCQKIRQTIVFPTCWDGKNLDSPDHQSHVAYGTSRAAGGGGNCNDAKFPVKLPQIMYEVMWDVSAFVKDTANWPTAHDPFVYSMNQGGSAAHGDYVFGWKDDTLQRAMDKSCNLNTACPAAGLTTQTPQQYSACTKKQQAPEPVDGWIASMPVGSPLRLA